MLDTGRGVLFKQSMTQTRQPKTRIQQKNTNAIMEAALDVFSQFGFRGSTLDQIAAKAGLSKPNLLYYFPSKEAIHSALLEQILDTWDEPLAKLDPQGDPEEQIMRYVLTKLEMARDYPRESRLFANELLHGAPNIKPLLEGEIKALVDEKAAVIQGWIDAGQIADLHPHHLIFSIWSLTQYYADFDVQVRVTLTAEGQDPFPGAETYLRTLFHKLLQPS